MRKKVITALLAVFCLLLACGVGFLFWRIWNAERYTKQLSLGDKYLQEMDYENAELCYKNAISIDEKKMAAYLNLSVVYADQGDYESAAAILEEAQKAGAAEGKEAAKRLEEQKDAVKKIQEEMEGNSQDSEENPAEDEERDDTGETDSEDDTEENGGSWLRDDSQGNYTAASAFAARNGWAYVNGKSAIYIFRDGQEGIQGVCQGEPSEQIMAVDDGIYYGMNENFLYFYSWKTQEATRIYSSSGYVEPLAISEKYLYFTESPSREADAPEIVQMRLADGTLRRFSIQEFCMHSDLLMIGERIFFTRGVADVGTSSLLELDPETGSVTELEPHMKSVLVADENILYYNRTDESGDYQQLEAELVALDTITGAKKVLTRQDGMDLGMRYLVTARGLYAVGNRLQKIEEGNAVLIAEEDAAVSQAWSDLGYVYYTVGRELFRYNETTGETELVRTLGEGDYILGISAGYIYYYMKDEGYIQEKL